MAAASNNSDISERTSEPQPLSFALLRHFYDRNAADGLSPGDNHWDLLLEFDSEAERVATFKFTDSPADLAAGESINASVQADHRRKYLSYSGEVSGNRGYAELIDSGQLRLLDVPTPAAPAGNPEAAKNFELLGEKLCGHFQLLVSGPTNVTLTRLL